MKTALFEPRWYRACCHGTELVRFLVQYKESDLQIHAQSDLSAVAFDLLIRARRELESYIHKQPEFGHSLMPVPVNDEAPDLIRKMAKAASKAGVGPMASVAGAISEAVARGLMRLSPNLIIENGGDIYAHSLKPVVSAVYAGRSPLSMRLGLEIDAEHGVGICTSSGTVGHSLSFGCADAVTVIAEDCAFADAAATAIGNMVKDRSVVKDAIECAKSIAGIKGVLIICDKEIGVWGDGFNLVDLQAVLGKDGFDRGL